MNARGFDQDRACERWRCGTDIDWEGLRRLTPLAVCVATRSFNLFACLMAFSLATVGPLAFFAVRGPGPLALAGIATLLAFGLANYIFAKGIYAAELQLAQAESLWLNLFKQRGSPSPRRDIDLLTKHAARLHFDKLRTAAPAVNVQLNSGSLWASTVECWAITHGRRLDKSSSAAVREIQRPNIRERACILLCLAACALLGFKRLPRLMPDTKEMELRWREAMPRDAAEFDRQALLAEAGDARPPSNSPKRL